LNIEGQAGREITATQICAVKEEAKGLDSYVGFMTHHRPRRQIIAGGVFESSKREGELTMTRLQTFAGLIVCGYLSWAVPARADAVVEWNAIAVQAITTAVPPHPGPTGFLDIAVVQAAVYDAVESIDGRFQPYHVRVPGASGSPAAAVAKAAHDVLVNRFPRRGRFA
jgi:hypothetical protein